MYSKILVPIDDFGSAGLALENAAKIAKSTSAEIVLFHVISDVNPLVISDEHVGGVHAAASVVERARQDESVHLAEQEAKLQRLADSIAGDGVSTRVEATIGNPHNEIVRAVETFGADLVIISTHARRGVSRAILGSVADEIVRDVDVPVMIVRRS